MPRAWRMTGSLQPPASASLCSLPRGAGPALRMPENVADVHLLSDEAEWDAPAWAMEPELLPPFAEAVRVLGEELPQGFALRATWVGSEVREKRVLGEHLGQLQVAALLCRRYAGRVAYARSSRARRRRRCPIGGRGCRGRAEGNAGGICTGVTRPRRFRSRRPPRRSDGEHGRESGRRPCLRAPWHRCGSVPSRRHLRNPKAAGLDSGLL